MAFFDKVGASLTKMSNDVSSKTKSMVEVTNINGQLRSSEAQLQAIFCEVGKAYYKANKNKELDNEEMTKLFDQVKEAEEAIVHLKSLLHKAKGTVECTNCHAEMPFGTLFCSACGAKIGTPEEVEEEDAPKVECPKCHKELKAGAAFCDSCGTKIN